MLDAKTSNYYNKNNEVAIAMSDIIQEQQEKTTRKKNKLVYGVGVNDADYTVTHSKQGKRISCPFYNTWKCMLGRCYSAKHHIRRPSYKDCSVCDEWLLFSNFKKWMMEQDWEGKELDKDILHNGNKQYSPENCIFVSRSINLLFTHVKNNACKYPTGVYFNKHTGIFYSQLKKYGKVEFIGHFNTTTEAQIAYQIAKIKHVYEVAAKQSDLRLANALRNHCQTFEYFFLAGVA